MGPRERSVQLACTSSRTGRTPMASGTLRPTARPAERIARVAADIIDVHPDANVVPLHSMAPLCKELPCDSGGTFSTVYSSV